MSLSQVLAPQLQQSLALLQAPTLELKALVEQEVQQNPMLEEVPASEMEQQDRNRDEGSPANDPNDLAEPPADVIFDLRFRTSHAVHRGRARSSSELPRPR